MNVKLVVHYLFGVLRCDRDVIREVAMDPASTWMDLALAGVASFFGGLSGGPLAGLVGVILAPAFLFLLVGLLFVSSGVLGGSGSYLALWRPSAFAWVLSSLNLLGGLSVVGPVIALVICLYLMFVAIVVVQSTQGLSFGRSVAAAAVVWGLCACLPFAGALVIGQSSALAPFVYAIF